MANIEEAKTTIRNWIIGQGNNQDAELTNESAILADGFLDSAGVLELVFLIEDITGQEVDVESLNQDSFRNINTICDALVAPHLS